MRTSLKKRNPIRLWFLTLILIIATLIYMVFAIFSNFETPISNPQNISNDKQSGK